MDFLLAIFGDNVVYFSSEKQSIDPAWYKIFDPHGRFVGWSRDIQQLNRTFLRHRRCLSIDMFVTRFQDDTMREWRVHCDMGRMVRPLLVVEHLHKIPQLVRACAPGTSVLPALLTNGCLEYVCPSEEQSLRTTFDLPTPGTLDEYVRTHTHLEVCDVSFVGIIAALAPFFRHNQGPRLVYWVGMSKQAIGTTGKKDRGSATTHNMWYGQRPLVATQTARDLNMDQIADCTNVVMIMYAMAGNQEDALIINRASVDKGMFVSDSVRTYYTEKQRSMDDVSGERFENPVKGHTFAMKDADYGKIQANGLPRAGTKVNGSDVIIGKSVPIKKISSSAIVNVPKTIKSIDYQKKRRDKSIQVRDDEQGTVESALLARTPQYDIAKVRVRTTRIPEVADKFASRDAQVG